MANHEKPLPRYPLEPLPSSRLELTKESTLEKKFLTVTALKNTLLAENLTYLQFRNLTIKQMILKDDKTYAQIGAEFFPPLTGRQISEIATNFNIHKSKKLKPWTNEDVEIIREQYGKTSLARLSGILRRSPKSVAWKASTLGIPSQINLKNQKNLYLIGHRTRGPIYTAEEKQFLKDNPNMPLAQISSILGRKRRSISYQRQHLGICTATVLKTAPKKWTTEDIEFLKSNPNMSAKDIAAKLSKRTDAVYSWKYELGIHTSTKSPKWTTAEIEILETAPSMTYIKQHIHRGHIAICNKLDELGIIIPTRRTPTKRTDRP